MQIRRGVHSAISSLQAVCQSRHEGRLHFRTHCYCGGSVGLLLPARVQGLEVRIFEGLSADFRLEQIDLMFEQKVPARHSNRWGKEHRAANITIDSGGHIATDEERKVKQDPEDADKDAYSYVVQEARDK